MWPFQSHARPPLTQRAALRALPLRNPRVESTRSPSGRLLVTVHRPERGMARLLSYFVAIPRKRTFELDERGERFWELCDGRRDLKRLEETVRREWELAPDEAREAVYLYTGHLMKRGLLVVKAPAGKGGQKDRRRR